MDELARMEYEAWRSLCALLVQAGAVTHADLRAPKNAPTTTPGLDVLAAIRRWAELATELALPEDRRSDA